MFVFESSSRSTSGVPSQWTRATIHSFFFVLFFGVVTLPQPVDSFVHGWDNVGQMLGSNLHGAFNGRYTPEPQSLKHWEWIANNYAVVVVGRFEDFNPAAGYNCTCPLESSRTQVARILKKINPKIKLLWYQNVVGDFTCACCNAPVRAHPEWWLYDDHGKPVLFQGTAEECLPASGGPAPVGCAPHLDWTVPAAREFWMNQPFKEVCGNSADAKGLIDGMMMDGAMYSNPSPNISTANYAIQFEAKLSMLSEADTMFKKLNGGEVWGNPLMPSGAPHWGPPRPTDPVRSYNDTLQHYSGAFDESFGAFNTLEDEWGECITGKPAGPNHINCTGDWDVAQMMQSIYAMRNATILDKKSLCLHMFVGPAGTPIGSVNGTAPTTPQPPHYTSPGEVTATGWFGPVKAPWQVMQQPEYTPLDVVNAMKQASADMLVESLAPFLIVAEETSFFGYGWFYDVESGYAPCDDNRTLCLAPDGWHPAFSRHLGPPDGPAVQSGVNGTVWTREFEGASVFVDLTNRTLARITWK